MEKARRPGPVLLLPIATRIELGRLVFDGYRLARCEVSKDRNCARIIATLTTGPVPFIKSVIGAPVTAVRNLIRSKRGSTGLPHWLVRLIEGSVWPFATLVLTRV